MSFFLFLHSRVRFFPTCKFLGDLACKFPVMGVEDSFVFLSLSVCVCVRACVGVSVCLSLPLVFSIWVCFCFVLGFHVMAIFRDTMPTYSTECRL